MAGTGAFPRKRLAPTACPRERPESAPPGVQTSSSLADALLVIAEAFLGGKIAAADNPEVYQVIVHVGADALSPERSGR